MNDIDDRSRQDKNSAVYYSNQEERWLGYILRHGSLVIEGKAAGEHAKRRRGIEILNDVKNRVSYALLKTHKIRILSHGGSSRGPVVRQSLDYITEITP